MYDLLRFLFQNSSFLVFLVLEFVSLSLVIKYNDHQANIISETSANLTGYLQSRNTQVRDYLELKEERDKLTTQNEQLSKELYELREYYKLDTTDLVRKTPVNYDIITARVVGNSINQANNMMILDKGSTSGVEKGDGVIGNGSVMGVVSDVSPEYAQCISILNTNMKTVAQIEEINAFGSVTWQPFDDRYVVLNDIPKHYGVKEGQHVSTSAFSTVFPPGITIGVVENVNSRPGRNDLDIKVRLTNSPYDVTVVQIIKPTNTPEFDED